ncbi:MAG: sensor histidine kinase [Phototrophicaceae bacterium]
MLFRMDDAVNPDTLFSEMLQRFKQVHSLDELVKQLIADLGEVINLLAYHAVVWNSHGQVVVQKSYPHDGVLVCDSSSPEQIFTPHPLGGQQFWVGFWQDGRLLGKVSILTDVVRLEPATHDGLLIWRKAVEFCLSDQLIIHQLRQDLETLQLRQEFSIKIARRLAQAELAAGIAHQLNNPLTAMLGNVEMLLLDVSVDDPTYARLQTISQSTTRMVDVVRRLMSALYPPKSYSVPQLTNLIVSANEAIQLIHNFIEAGKTTLIVDLPSEPIPEIWAESDALVELFLNLLMNARDAVVNREGGMIGFALQADVARKLLVIEVWDNGCGIPEEEHEMIFEPFYSTKPSTERLGLGLHLCKQIVGRLGGAIHVTSHPIGGAHFTVEIPFKRGL